MSIGSRIKQRREELGYTQPQLAALLDVSKGTVGNYESGISSPNENILFRLFDVLKCDANFLYQDDIKITENITFTQAERDHIKKYRSLDSYGKKTVDNVLNIESERCEESNKIMPLSIELPLSECAASAGTGNWLDEEYTTRVRVLSTPQSLKANIIIPVSGESMEPLFFDGDKVLVRLQADVDVGEIGIFIVDNEGYIKKRGKNKLISVNPEYEDIEIGEFTQCYCVGKVLGKAGIIE